MDDAFLANAVASRLELRLNQRIEHALLAHQLRRDRQNQANADEGHVHHRNGRVQRQHVRRQQARIRPLIERYARVVAQLPRELPVAHVNRIDMRRAVLEADVREAAGRRADVHAHFAAQIRLKGRNCLFQLQSAAAGVGVRLAADLQLVLRLNQLRCLVDAARADVHLARHDADLRLRAAFAKPAFHQRHISPLLFAH